MIAADYAQALQELGSKATMSRVRAVLERRGHLTLLPRIFGEYKKLALRQERRKRRGTPTAEQERIRILLELYKKLTHV